MMFFIWENPHFLRFYFLKRPMYYQSRNTCVPQQKLLPRKTFASATCVRDTRLGIHPKGPSRYSIQQGLRNPLHSWVDYVTMVVSTTSTWTLKPTTFSLVLTTNPRLVVLDFQVLHKQSFTNLIWKQRVSLGPLGPFIYDTFWTHGLFTFQLHLWHLILDFNLHFQTVLRLKILRNFLHSLVHMWYE